MRTAPLTIALLLVSSAATTPLPYGPLNLDGPNGTVSSLERRAEVPAVFVKTKDWFQSTWQDVKSAFDPKPSLHSQDSLANDRLSDTAPSGDRTDAAAPKLSVAGKLKQAMITKPVEGARAKLNDMGKHVAKYKKSYAALGVVSATIVGIGAGCGFTHLTAVNKIKAKNARMLECDQKIDRGESESSALKGRDVSSDEDLVLVSRSPKGSGIKLNFDFKKMGNPLAKSCKKTHGVEVYEPRYAVCKRA